MRSQALVFCAAACGRMALLAVAMTVLVTMTIAPVQAQNRAQTESDPFDYYVLALSWTPSWCALEGDARRDDRCAPGGANGWLVHGLWPQFEGGGWPEYCATSAPAPSRAQTAAMTDIMGASGLAWHQWNKHGRCSGLRADAYFDTTRRARAAVVVPDLFGRITRDLRVAPDVIKAAFLEENPGFDPDALTVTCRDGQVQEVRLCLTKSLTPRSCDTQLRARACRAPGITLPSLR